MVSDSELQALESIIVNHAGPMGKFIIKKSLSDIGAEPGRISGDIQVKFINMVIERAIFDKDRQVIARKEILSALGGGTNV